VVSQLALAIPMCLLYEVGIWAAQLFIKHTKAPEDRGRNRFFRPDGSAAYLWHGSETQTRCVVQQVLMPSITALFGRCR
jgi:hypothetical protein